MKKIIINILIAIFLINLLGCATATTRLENNSRDTKIYPATYSDGEVIYQVFTPKGIHFMMDEYFDGWSRIPILLFSTIDLPISITSDTLFLPWDVYRWNFPKKPIESIKKQNQEKLKTEQQEKPKIQEN